MVYYDKVVNGEQERYEEFEKLVMIGAETSRIGAYRLFVEPEVIHLKTVLNEPMDADVFLAILDSLEKIKNLGNKLLEMPPGHAELRRKEEDPLLDLNEELKEEINFMTELQITHGVEEDE